MIICSLRKQKESNCIHKRKEDNKFQYILSLVRVQRNDSF